MKGWTFMLATLLILSTPHVIHGVSWTPAYVTATNAIIPVSRAMKHVLWSTMTTPLSSGYQATGPSSYTHNFATSPALTWEERGELLTPPGKLVKLD